MISCRRCVNIRRRVSIRCFRNGPSPTTDCVQGDHEEAGHVGRHVRAQPREVQGARPHGLQEGRAYAFVLMCINTGTRNKEIRFTEVGDLDTRFWTFDIIHVKEEASCGLPRRIPTPRKSVRSSPTVSCYARSGWRTILWIHQRPSLEEPDDGFLYDIILGQSSTSSRRTWASSSTSASAAGRSAKGIWTRTSTSSP